MPNLSKQLERISRQLAPKIDSTLAHEVADAVRDQELDAIRDVVYGAYTPKLYHRRGDIDGLADPYNIEATVKDGKLEVVNRAQPNPGGTLDDSRVTTGKYLDELVEYGHGGSGGFYDFPKSGAAFMRPRPFTAETKARLSKNKKHVKAFLQGLKKRGVDITT